MNLGEIFGDQIQSGVFRLDNAADLSRLSAIANEKKFSIYVFDGSEFASKGEFIAHFAKVMNPPNAFADWDYFERQLELTEWLEKESGEVIIYKNVQHFHTMNRKDFDILMDIFLCVTRFRNKRPHLPPLLVFLQGNESVDLPFPLETVEI